jgi:lysophospholipase L1-like esterase
LEATRYDARALTAPPQIDPDKEVPPVPSILPRTRIATAILFVAILGSSRSALGDSMKTYLAIGDSMAFGETDFTQNPSNGDRGYVKGYADYLGAQNGGVRPNLINLGVDGETTSTFFNGGPHGDGPAPGQPAPQLNTNYTDPSMTQNSLMLSTIATEKAAGHDIANVTVQLGANDLYAVASSPGFFTMSPADQQAKLAQAFGTILSNDTQLLTELRAQLPQTNLVLLGYHNPFAADPSSPIGQLAGPAIQALNALIAGEAAAFGARYVDTYTPFVGNELADTYIATGNVHPNDAGYALIVGQLEAVPEPSTLALVGIMFAGLLVHRRRAAR